ncbi:MAG TPA: BA14K family protein [Bradyrhizobium sp.]|nr:BA14K family protein [Bradyrhizobium sp.]
MINSKGFRATAAVAVVLSMTAPTAGFGENKPDHGSNARAGSYRPPISPNHGAPAAAAAPAAGAVRAVTPMPQPGMVSRGSDDGGTHAGFHGGDHDRDHDRDRDRGAFVPGGVVIIGGVTVISPAAAPAPVGDDAVAICMQTYSSYDPQSGTYVGDDGLLHSCP